MSCSRMRLSEYREDVHITQHDDDSSEQQQEIEAGNETEDDFSASDDDDGDIQVESLTER